MFSKDEINNWMIFDKAYSIEDPEIFKAKSFKINYLQEKGLTNSRLKKLRDEWNKILPALKNIEFAYFGHRITQESFEAICSMTNLRGLWIKVTQLEDFSIIKNLKKLNYLRFGGTIKITSLEGLESIPDLRSLELDKFFAIKNLDELSHLTKLEKLMLYGGNDGKRLNITDISGISNLTRLTSLVMDIKGKGIDLTPLFKLKNLDTLVLPASYFQDKTRADVLRIFPKLKRGVIDRLEFL